MIRSSQLLATPQVLFAGYKVPHPLHPYFILKIQTDGSITPQSALEQACTKLIGSLSSLESKFKREFSFKDVETSGSGAVGAGIVSGDDPYGTGAAGSAWGTGKDYLDF
jgi:DNA-directed RNA polymerase II subunit RPB11